MYKSDWLGIGVGIAIGAYQPFVLFDHPMVQNYSSEKLYFFVAFGLLFPPILAALIKFLPLGGQRFAKIIGKYLNTVFMMIAYGITTGIVGFSYYLLIGGLEEVLMQLSFFSSMGIGFYFAYLIAPELAYRPNRDA